MRNQLSRILGLFSRFDRNRSEESESRVQFEVANPDEIEQCNGAYSRDYAKAAAGIQTWRPGMFPDGGGRYDGHSSNYWH